MNHASLALVSLALLGGSLVMLWFVVLSGVTGTLPLSRTYFLRADTAGITGARAVSQWTYFYVCGDGNADCRRAHADLPVGYAWSGGPGNGAPADLVGPYGGGTTSRYYWFMWRFGWVFYLLALFFETLAFFAIFLAFFGRLGSAVAGLASSIALFFYTVGVVLMTVTFVKMRDVFQADGRDASVGAYAFGFSWGAWVALLLGTILLCMGVRSRKDKNAPAARWRRTGSTMSRASTSKDAAAAAVPRRVKEEYP